jgi:hypothetical protein
MVVDDDHMRELVRRLGREAATLVRSELELASACRIPAIQREARDGLALMVIGAAAMLAAGAATWAGVRAFDVGPGWLAPLVFALLWAAVAVGLALRLVRGGAVSDARVVLGAATGPENHDELIGRYQRERDRAEHEIMVTAEHLAVAIGRMVEQRELKAARAMIERETTEVIEREAGAVESEATSLLTEAVDAFTAPGRFAVSILGRTLGSSNPASGSNP